MSTLKKRNNYKIDNETLKKAVEQSISIAGVFEKLDLCNTGSAYKTLKRRISDLEIDISHFKGQGYLHGKTHNWAPKQDIEIILVQNSTYVSTSSLKKRLVKENILENRCYGLGCNITTHWNGSPIVLQLDHINGIHNDNRKENLRFLCPNCHSQTSTFAGKNKNIGG